jgi:hypothetical protein
MQLLSNDTHTLAIVWNGSQSQREQSPPPSPPPTQTERESACLRVCVVCVCEGAIPPPSIPTSHPDIWLTASSRSCSMQRIDSWASGRCDMGPQWCSGMNTCARPATGY